MCIAGFVLVGSTSYTGRCVMGKLSGQSPHYTMNTKTKCQANVQYPNIQSEIDVCSFCVRSENSINPASYAKTHDTYVMFRSDKVFK